MVRFARVAHHHAVVVGVSTVLTIPGTRYKLKLHRVTIVLRSIHTEEVKIPFDLATFTCIGHWISRIASTSFSLSVNAALRLVYTLRQHLRFSLIFAVSFLIIVVQE